MMSSSGQQIVATDDAVFADNENDFDVRVRVKTISMKKAPMEESKFRVLVELTGKRDVRHRAGLDLVMVLDVSESMGFESRKEKLNMAMEIVIKKLNPADRLSVVTFSDHASLLCPLRQMTKTSKEEIITLIGQTPTGGATNTCAGLELGLQVLRERKFMHGRSVGIMLISDGAPDKGGDATKVEIGQVPVYTFGFGTEGGSSSKMEDVLIAIARNSQGGTYSDVIDTKDLSIAFAQCLAGLLTIVVQDLKMIVTPQNNSIIEAVYAGDYTVSPSRSSRTISLGNLSNKEMRRVIIELILPLASREATMQILRVDYKYSNQEGTEISSSPIFERVKRTWKYAEPENLQVMIEGNRLQIARMMKEARMLADSHDMGNARNKLEEAEDILENANIDHWVINTLKSEIKRILTSMKSFNGYKSYGRRFALSSELSHERQRFAGRGDTGNLRLFATPRMVSYLKQIKKFQEDPKTKSLPTQDEDVTEELSYCERLSTCLNSCFSCCYSSLKNCFNRAIQNLGDVKNIVDTR